MASRTADREPLLLNPGEGRPESHLIGISGGLWNAVAVPTSADFGTLYDACIEAGRVYARLCNFTLSRSRAMEDRTGVWGWAVVGIAADELEKILEQFQHAMVTSSPWVPMLERGYADVRHIRASLVQRESRWLLRGTDGAP